MKRSIETIPGNESFLQLDRHRFRYLLVFVVIESCASTSKTTQSTAKDEIEKERKNEKVEKDEEDEEEESESEGEINAGRSNERARSNG